MVEMRVIIPQYAKGSIEEKFAKLQDKYCGKATYFQEYDTDTKEAGKVFVDRERKLNEFGGQTFMSRIEEEVTITKVDAAGVQKEVVVKNINEFDI